MEDQIFDPYGMRLHDGDRVYVYDEHDARLYGTLYKNKDFPHVSDYYIEYDDGQECAVLDMSSVYKA